MKRSLFSRFVVTGVLAAAALGAAFTADARPDATVSIFLPGPPVFVRPPVLLPPLPVFDQRPAYGPSVVGAWDRRYGAHDDFERERARRHAEWQRREWERREWQRREWERQAWHRHHHGGFPSHEHGRD